MHGVRVLSWLSLFGGWMGAAVIGVLLVTGEAVPRSDLLWGAALPFAFLVVGSVAFQRRRDQRAAGWLLGVGAFHMSAVALSALVLALLDESPPGWLWTLNLVSVQLFFLGFAAYLALFAVFPDGRYERKYERRAVTTAIVASLALPVLSLLASDHQPVVLAPDSLGVPSPFTVPALSPLSAVPPLMLAAPLVGLAIFVPRYRRSDPEQRLQMRWPLLSAVAGGAALGLSWLLGPVVPGSVDLLFVLALASLPLTLFVGMVRHRLFDVDVVIRRSIVFGVLWLIIGLAYGAVAAALGMAAGERFPVNVAVIVTIVASMAFHPARQRLERLADRIAFGKRPTRYEALRRVAELLERGPHLDELAQHLAETARDAIDARWVRVSVTPRGEGAIRPLGSAGVEPREQVTATVTVPLVHDEELLGQIECGLRREGRYGTTEEDLLVAMAGQSALAVRSARLSDDLARRLEQLDRQARELASSRMRLIQAEEAERRRIERDLHDGIQQELVALMARIELARTQLSAETGETVTALSDLQQMVGRIHHELRELARGIHPALLSDRGLVEAVEARAHRLPIEATVDADAASRDSRYPAEVEGAAYYVISEALTNVMKHAKTDAVTVRIATEGGHLHIEVQDEGRGFQPDLVDGSGLRGSVDRLEALGGKLQVHSAPGSGTTLTAVLPIPGVNDA